MRYERNVERVPGSWFPGGFLVVYVVGKAEATFQLASIVPLDAETVWQHRIASWKIVLDACWQEQKLANLSRPGNGLGCSRLLQLDNLRILAASTPESLPSVKAMLTNASFPMLREVMENRVGACATRDRSHAVKCRAMCGVSAVCQSVFGSLVSSTTTEVMLSSLLTANIPLNGFAFGGFGVSYFSRPCLGSSVPWEMCHRELWIVRYFNAVVDTDLIALMLAAIEPVNEKSFLFQRVESVLQIDDRDRNGGVCFWDVCNGTMSRAEDVRSYFSSATVDENGTLWYPSYSLTSTNVRFVKECWFGCALRSLVTKKMQLALRKREYCKYDFLFRMRIYCPDDQCIRTVDAIRTQIFEASNLRFVALQPEKFFYDQAFSPDRGVVAIGLVVSALGLLVSFMVIWWGKAVWSVPHLRVLVFIGFGVFLWCLLRLIWWVSFTPLGESWTEISSGDVFLNMFAWDFVAKIFQYWTDMVVLCIQIILFSLLLNNWLEALAFLANFGTRLQAVMKMKQMVLLCLSVLSCFGAFATAIYATVAVCKGLDDPFQSWALRQDIPIMFRVYSVVALTLSMGTLTTCLLGLCWLRKDHIFGVVQAIIFFSLVDIGMIFRCLWAFGDSGFSSLVGSVVFLLCYLLGEMMVLSGLLGYALAGVVAFHRSQRPPSDVTEPLLSEDREQKEDGRHVPLQYRC